MPKVVSVALLLAISATPAFAETDGQTPATGIIKNSMVQPERTTSSIGRNTSLYRPPQAPTYKVNPSLNRMNCAGASAGNRAIAGRTPPATVPAGSHC